MARLKVLAAVCCGIVAGAAGLMLLTYGICVIYMILAVLCGAHFSSNPSNEFYHLIDLLSGGPEQGYAFLFIGALLGGLSAIVLVAVHQQRWKQAMFWARIAATVGLFSLFRVAYLLLGFSGYFRKHGWSLVLLACVSLLLHVPVWWGGSLARYARRQRDFRLKDSTA